MKGIDTGKAISALIALNIVSLSAIAWLVMSGFSTGDKAKFTEIDAERINIVGANGKPVLALSNKEHIPGPSMNGKTYDREISDGRQFFSGMIFFNEEGDEVGGLIYAGMKRKDGGYSQVGHLSFDQWKQNQVVALESGDNGKTRRAGLTIIDRPTDVMLDKQLDLIQKRLTASPDEKKAISKELEDMQAKGENGYQRLFIGSQDKTAQVQLRDTKGRTRARLVVDDKDAARLEFLDETGKVTNTYPGPG